MGRHPPWLDGRDAGGRSRARDRGLARLPAPPGSLSVAFRVFVHASDLVRCDVHVSACDDAGARRPRRRPGRPGIGPVGGYSGPDGKALMGSRLLGRGFVVALS